MAEAQVQSLKQQLKEAEVELDEKEKLIRKLLEDMKEVEAGATAVKLNAVAKVEEEYEEEVQAVHSQLSEQKILNRKLTIWQRAAHRVVFVRMFYSWYRDIERYFYKLMGFASLQQRKRGVGAPDLSTLRALLAALSRARRAEGTAETAQEIESCLEKLQHELQASDEEMAVFTWGGGDTREEERLREEVESLRQALDDIRREEAHRTPQDTEGDEALRRQIAELTAELEEQKRKLSEAMKKGATDQDTIADEVHSALCEKSFERLCDALKRITSPRLWGAVQSAFALHYPSHHPGGLRPAIKDALSELQLLQAKDLLHRNRVPWDYPQDHTDGVLRDEVDKARKAVAQQEAALRRVLEMLSVPCEQQETARAVHEAMNGDTESLAHALRDVHSNPEWGGVQTAYEGLYGVDIRDALAKKGKETVQQAQSALRANGVDWDYRPQVPHGERHQDQKRMVEIADGLHEA
eukprot:Sspe_Gene.21334::Locus_7986_Transcript_1_1_Confidence_1.000_Length_1583::g.21334::m.21334